MERQPVFVECQKCGEVWKLLTLPIGAMEFSRRAKRAGQCPNCGEIKAVTATRETEARNGVINTTTQGKKRDE